MQKTKVKAQDNERNTPMAKYDTQVEQVFSLGNIYLQQVEKSYELMTSQSI